MKISLQTTASPAGDITLITIANAQGASVTLSSVGAGIHAINVPDRSGKLTDVLLGYADPVSYLADPPCMGKTPGRYANRIAHGRFMLDGKEYTLECNCGPHHLHGGSQGFQNRIWRYDIDGDNAVKFTLTSPDGDSGYPGRLDVSVLYRWTDDCHLEIEYEALAHGATPVSLTNHAYFNLNGEGSGTALQHRLHLGCSRYVATDDTMQPTGAYADVHGTPMDFTGEAREVGSRIREDFKPLHIGAGYDHCFVVDGFADDHGRLCHAATLVGDRSGIRLDIFTTMPGVQLYTANWLTGTTPPGKNGHSYHNNEAVAIECQMIPDSPNHARFPNTILRANEKLHDKIEYVFTTD